jgi:hypothetical protein
MSKLLWADMEDSDLSDDENNLKGLNSATDIKSNNNIIFDNFNNLIAKAQDENYKKEIYSLVVARIKNYSHVGINKVEKNIQNFDNLKLEFFYTKRDLKINKIYKKKSLEDFTHNYNNVMKSINEKNVDKLNVINKDLLQYFIHTENYIYIPFFKVDGKYFDLIKYININKKYEIVLYPIQL